MDVGTSALPRDLEEAAVARLAFISMVTIAGMMVAMVTSFFRQANIGPRAGLERPMWVVPVGVLLSLGMLLAARSGRLRPSTKLVLGLAYMIACCAMLALFRHWLPYVPQDVFRGFSPVTIGILFFATVVPMSPGRMAVAATVAALTDPAALGLTIALGNPVPPGSFWLWLFMPNAVAVGLAVAAARVVYGLGQDVRRARQLGSYRLLDRLGAGGMGEVWRAEHATLARPAAVKLVRPGVLGDRTTAASQNMLRRFEREAQATALLSSPHTIELYDYGVGDDETFYYVMELLDGMDLETMLNSGEVLAPARAVHLLLGLCHSLRDAHHAGVIHRDIKPANIFVCQKGGDLDFVKLLDFGLVRRVDVEADSRLTGAGDLVGTPHYMAPECVGGDVPVDGRSDLYSLGCVAYRMLAGREVFVEATPMQMLIAQMHKPPTPLSELAPEVPDALAGIVMRCLQKPPADRPKDAAELMRQLRETKLAEEWTQADARAWWAAWDQTQAESPLDREASSSLADADTVGLGPPKPPGDDSALPSTQTRTRF